MKSADFNLISPTAKLVAYLRQKTDIPFAKDVGEIIGADDFMQSHFNIKPEDLEDLEWMRIMLEARYKSIGRFIAREKVTQILELASGISLRGLAMTENPSIRYIESDLPNINVEKKKIVAEIRRRYKLPERANLSYADVNVISREDMIKTAATFLPKQKIAIVHEGLLPYFNDEEKISLAENIKQIFMQREGVWITPDVITKKNFQAWENNFEKKQFSLLEKVSQMTMRDMRATVFENEEHAKEFFDKLGFSAEVHNQFEDDSFAQEFKIWVLRLS